MKLWERVRSARPAWHVTLYALAVYILATGPGLPGFALSAAAAGAGALYQYRRRNGHNDRCR